MTTATQIKWCDNKTESELILKIVKRAESIAKSHQLPIPKRHTLLMDIEACHCNGMALKLPELLAAKDSDFAHDVFGIVRHINRENGQIENCFVPRYARP